MSGDYQIILADIPLNIHLASDLNLVNMASWLLRESDPLYRSNVTADNRVSPITDAEFAEEWHFFLQTSSKTGRSLSELSIKYEMLQRNVSDALLSHHACIFHGVAFLWREKAYLFSAPSGTGKTTQYRRWRELYGDEVRILNGDKPALKITDSSVMVYPSPWHGKEGYGRGFAPVPLHGIVFLEQGAENRIEKLSYEESGLPLFNQMIYSGKDEKVIRGAAAFVSRLAELVPVWRLINLGNHESAKLTHDTILAFEEIRSEEVIEGISDSENEV